MADNFSADFTVTGNSKAIQCGRSECPVKFYPANTDFHFLHSSDPSVPGRAVCTPCYEYYRVKKTTQRRPVGKRRKLSFFILQACELTLHPP
jgi:hypothetical protein